MERPTAAGALGPRLAGRLTAELILRCPQYMNCVKEYELDLRGNKLSVIENLGATENQFDSLDLSDNAIGMLEGFPKLSRLRTLLINNNRIARIARNLEESIPNLECLVLTSNKLNNLADLDPLTSCSRLRQLSLLDNPVTKKQNYRLYVINRCPQLKVLDFRKIKQKEREDAARAFGAPPAAVAAAAGPPQKQPRKFDPDQELAQAEKRQKQQQAEETAAAEEAAPEPSARKGPTPEQQTALRAAIANAQTLAEVQRLEDALRSGQVPSELADGAANGTTANATPMEED
ncbi:hypothetical protein WJX74_006892 [Apatococcus lobatus]|uniref:U2A'/phosphoprotein 32 family A C-terminal domain-containing protein n=2 Tax=Apatococcus TaxID=904362 RepID=A0AAW1T946_9CHLO